MLRELRDAKTDAPEKADEIDAAIRPLLEEYEQINSQLWTSRFDELPERTPTAVLGRLMDICPDIFDEAFTQLRTMGTGMNEDGLFDPAAVMQLVEGEIKPYLDYLKANGTNNEYINAIHYIQNGLSDPNFFISTEDPLPLGDSYQRVTTTLSTMPTDAPAQPTHLISPTDNVSNITFKPRETIDLYNKEVPTYRGFTTMLSVEFENDDAVSISGGISKLTSYDRYVHDAICSLFITDNPRMEPRNITPAMIYRVIAAKPGGRIPPKQAAQIEHTIEKLRRTNIAIRETNNTNDTQEISSHLISGAFGKRIFYGHSSSVLRVTEAPILFSYAATKKQISRAPLELFRIEGVSNYSTDFILVMQYLWRRIVAMKGSSNLSRTIRFDAIYENVDLDPAEFSASALANKKKAIRDHTRTILDNWKNNQSFIYDYTLKTKGREFVSVDIAVHPPKGIEGEDVN